MSRTIMAGLVWLMVVLAGAWAQVPASRTAVTPGAINYQGRLTTANGEIYSNGVYQIEFRLYTASSGGTLLWGGKYSCYLKDGYFNVMLGSSGGQSVSGTAPTYAPTELWKALWYNPSNPQNQLFLALKVLADVNGDTILPADAVEAFPRQQLLCSPFAERAQVAQYARQSLTDFSVPADLDVTSDADIDGTLRVGGAATLEAGLGVTGTTTLGGALTVSGASTHNNGLVVNGGLTDINNGLDVSGTATLRGGVTVSGNGTFNSAASVATDLTVGDEIVAERVSPRGFAANPDNLLEFGSGYTLSGDNAGSANGATTRLWMNTPTTGEISMGPRAGGSRMKYFQVQSDSTVFDGASADFRNISSFKIEGTPPFHLHKYTWSNTETVDYNTSVSTADWTAMIVGFDAGYCDVDESGAEWSWKALMVPVSGQWHIQLEGHTHDNHPDWVIHVLYIRKELTYDGR